MAVDTSHVVITNYSLTNVITSAYLQVVASSPSAAKLQILDTSGKIVKIAIGAPGSEVDFCVCPVSGMVIIPNSYIAPNSSISLKAIDASATTGYNTLSFIG